MMRMKTRTAILAVVFGAADLAAPAQGASIRECGNYGWPSDYTGSHPIFTYRQIDGAGTYNITSRVLTCAEARRVVRGADRVRRFRARVRGLRCRLVDQGWEYTDVRCTGTRGRVVRWQSRA